MASFARCVRDYRALWRSWLPLLLLSLATPPIVLALPLLEKHLIDSVVPAHRLDRLAGPPRSTRRSGCWPPPCRSLAGCCTPPWASG